MYFPPPPLPGANCILFCLKIKSFEDPKKSVSTPGTGRFYKKPHKINVHKKVPFDQLFPPLNFLVNWFFGWFGKCLFPPSSPQHNRSPPRKKKPPPPPPQKQKRRGSPWNCSTPPGLSRGGEKNGTPEKVPGGPQWEFFFFLFFIPGPPPSFPPMLTPNNFFLILQQKTLLDFFLVNFVPLWFRDCKCPSFGKF